MHIKYKKQKQLLKNSDLERTFFKKWFIIKKNKDYIGVQMEILRMKYFLLICRLFFSSHNCHNLHLCPTFLVGIGQTSIIHPPQSLMYTTTETINQLLQYIVKIHFITKPTKERLSTAGLSVLLYLGTILIWCYYSPRQVSCNSKFMLPLFFPSILFSMSFLSLTTSQHKL